MLVAGRDNCCYGPYYCQPLSETLTAAMCKTSAEWTRPIGSSRAKDDSQTTAIVIASVLATLLIIVGAIVVFVSSRKRARKLEMDQMTGTASKTIQLDHSDDETDEGAMELGMMSNPLASQRSGRAPDYGEPDVALDNSKQYRVVQANTNLFSEPLTESELSILEYWLSVEITAEEVCCTVIWVIGSILTDLFV